MLGDAAFHALAPHSERAGLELPAHETNDIG
ncbi:MAG: hypothetical protein RLZZ290_1185, partial [Pseudomonadota bacterium]